MYEVFERELLCFPTDERYSGGRHDRCRLNQMNEWTFSNLNYILLILEFNDVYWNWIFLKVVSKIHFCSISINGYIPSTRASTYVNETLTYFWGGDSVKDGQIPSFTCKRHHLANLWDRHCYWAIFHIFKSACLSMFIFHGWPRFCNYVVNNLLLWHYFYLHFSLGSF